MRTLLLGLVLLSTVSRAEATAPTPDGNEPAMEKLAAEPLDAQPVTAIVPPAVDAQSSTSATDDAADAAEASDGTGGDESEGSDEAEVPVAECAADGGAQYSVDLSDDELGKRFVEDLPSLGSISVGLAEAGRLINGVQLEQGEAWSVITPDNAWGTQETVEAIKHVAQAVRDAHPDAAPLRVNHIGRQNGGYLRPHQSHQSGRDVDLGFYYQAGVDLSALKTSREKSMDLAANWALIRAIATDTDAQFVLVDRRVQRVLYDYALSIGEDRGWLEQIFHGPNPLLRHARRHRDHFHVRFFAPRSQELGRRIQPLLARRPDENLVIHRVRSGDTLGGLASRYGSSVRLIQKANGLTSTMLRVGRTLHIPLRGPCTNCPIPPPVIVPPRRLPPVQPEARAPLRAPWPTSADTLG